LGQAFETLVRRRTRTVLIQEWLLRRAKKLTYRVELIPIVGNLSSALTRGGERWGSSGDKGCVLADFEITVFCERGLQSHEA